MNYQPSATLPSRRAAIGDAHPSAPGIIVARLLSRVSRMLHDRIETLPSDIRNIAWKGPTSSQLTPRDGHGPAGSKRPNPYTQPSIRGSSAGGDARGWSQHQSLV
jgi:hypothetical protein